jgi:ectoine hydroxylase-related dioxygenase (phytanoyl-CoA dioxygenase family)
VGGHIQPAGFSFPENVLPPNWCRALREDLEYGLRENPNGLNSDGEKTALCHRMFEFSNANLRLFDMEPIISFAEALVAENCHVIHNNSFVTRTGGEFRRHQDDLPHYIVTEGEPPTNVHLPVMWFTCNYYPTDVPERDYGGTEVIPGSHLLGRPCTDSLEGTEWEDQIHYNLSPAGSVIMFNNQVWHRGGPNRTERTRYITQVTYARRMVGHKYYTFMNYTMPASDYEAAGPQLKRLLGFLEHGAYG